MDQLKDQLCQAGAYFYQRGWSVGTSSNYSAILERDPLKLLVTASGKHKGKLTRDDFVVVGQDGRPTLPDQPKSSAETLLHVVAAAERPEVGAILHTHSVWSTLLSDLFFEEGGLAIEGYEMLKGLEGITTHESRVWLPIYENTQDIPALAEEVRGEFQRADSQMTHAYLIRKHGLYTWGVDIDAAWRHVEILEFLFECVAQRMQLTGERPPSYAAATNA